MRRKRPRRVPFVPEPSTPTLPARRATAALPPTASAASPRRTPTTILYPANAASPSSCLPWRQLHRDTGTPHDVNRNRARISLMVACPKALQTGLLLTASLVRPTGIIRFDTG